MPRFATGSLALARLSFQRPRDGGKHERAGRRQDKWRHTVRQVSLFCCLVAIVTGTRLDSFRHAVLDQDEAVYMLMAQSLVAGHVPYTHVWDHKPPGIYFLLAAEQRLFGRSITALRLLTCIAVATSAFLILCFGRFTLRRPPTGYMAGTLYVAFSTVNGGLAANTEIFFTPFIVAGFCLLGGVRRAPDGVRRRVLLVGAGASFGVAAEIKYVVFCELCAAAVALLVIERRRLRVAAAGLRRAGVFRDVAWLGAAALAMPALTTVYFYGRGCFAEYWYANVVANIVHASDTSFGWKELTRLTGALAQYSPLGILVGAAAALSLVGPEPTRMRRELLVPWLWLLAALAGVTATRRFYPHYFLQMLPPLCLIAAYVVQEAARSTAQGQEHRAIATLPCVLLLAMAVIAPVKRSVTEAASVLRSGGISMRADETIEVADYLERRVAPSDAFYVANYEAILYYLVPARRPTRYLFPPFLTSAHFAKVAGIDALDELRRIMSVVQPTFVVARATSMDREFDRALSRYLARDYALAVVIRDIRIYRRRTAT